MLLGRSQQSAPETPPRLLALQGCWSSSWGGEGAGKGRGGSAKLRHPPCSPTLGHGLSPAASLQRALGTTLPSDQQEQAVYHPGGRLPGMLGSCRGCGLCHCHCSTLLLLPPTVSAGQCLVVQHHRALLPVLGPRHPQAVCGLPDISPPSLLIASSRARGFLKNSSLPSCGRACKVPCGLQTATPFLVLETIFRHSMHGFLHFTCEGERQHRSVTA